MIFFNIPPEWLPIQLVALVSLGMALAFIVADYRSPTSRALSLAFGAFGLAIGLSLPLSTNDTLGHALGRWLALADATALIASLEWLRRVRRTIDVESAYQGLSNLLLWIGQLGGVFLGLAGLLLPDVRREHFIDALNNLDALGHPRFWLFGAPILLAIVSGGLASLLLLMSRPDRSERIRIIAALISFPMIVFGLLVQATLGTVLMLAGMMLFLVGAMQYVVVQGQRGQFMARFLSPQVEKLVRARGLKRAVQHRTLEISVVSVDMRGFTAFAGAHPSSSVIQTLREYYDAVGAVVARYGATIKDYAGDGVLILVGAPLPIDQHAARALDMAIGIRAAASGVTRRWSTQAYPLGLGIGVASGLVTVGIIGSASRWEYTAVGEAVNLASRLCERAGDGEILIAARTVELAKAGDVRPCEPVSVKGFAEPVAYYCQSGR